LFEVIDSGCSYEALADLKNDDAVTSGSAVRLVLLRAFVWSKD